jgi:hypothetical protein
MELFDKKYRDENGEIVWERIYKDAVPITREEMERQIRELRDAKRSKKT